MKIIVQFESGTQYWQDKVTKNAAIASRILSAPEFIAKVRRWPGFDYTDVTPDGVASSLELAGDIKIRVGFYKGWFWSRAIAYEEGGGVYFNTRKEAYGAGGVGNIAHETMHAMGYVHNGNAAAGNENTCPYRIGQWVEEWATNSQLMALANLKKAVVMA